MPEVGGLGGCPLDLPLSLPISLCSIREIQLLPLFQDKKIRPLPVSPSWPHVILKPENHHFLRRLLTQITLCPVGDSELKEV